MSREKKLQHILEKLNNATADIEGCAIVTNDGLVITSILPPSMEEDLVSAMSAALLGLGTRAADELDRGAIEQLYLKGQNGYMLITQAGEDAVLAVMATSHAKLGIVFLDVKRAAREIAAAL